jgi:hypothetical protein
VRQAAAEALCQLGERRARQALDLHPGRPAHEGASGCRRSALPTGTAWPWSP